MVKVGIFYSGNAFKAAFQCVPRGTNTLTGVGHREVSRTSSLLRKFWILLNEMVRFYGFGVYILVENGVPTCDMIINWTRRQLVIRNFNFLLNKINILIWYLYNQFCDYLVSLILFTTKSLLLCIKWIMKFRLTSQKNDN